MGWTTNLNWWPQDVFHQQYHSIIEHSVPWTLWRHELHINAINGWHHFNPTLETLWIKLQIPACSSSHGAPMAPDDRWRGKSVVVSMVEILHDPGCMKPYPLLMEEIPTNHLVFIKPCKLGYLPYQLVQHVHHQQHLLFCQMFSSHTQQASTHPRAVMTRTEECPWLCNAITSSDEKVSLTQLNPPNS